MSPEDKDAALLPRRINGYWALIHRPMTTTGAHMRISYSTDLRHWGGHKIILEARRGGWWDANKIGLCSPPIETPEGWLMIYSEYGTPPREGIYRLGLALFDLERPEICLQRGGAWMFGPEAPYERGGDVNDVVFPCGQRMEMRFISITGQPIRALLLPREAYVASSHGWMRISAQETDLDCDR